ncbi:MAG: ABC transporter substrate-binding protein [Gammaproteobacteria bacterium]|nr:ABC transporter substrate-binding protein [Gammaproteobacteria bacterium]
MKKLAFVTMLVLAGCGGADESKSGDFPRGITADTIKLGSHTDLSGGLAIWGVPATNGQRMRFEEANADGGIHGRNIEFIVEDSQYQMPISVKATNKLLHVDNIFMMVGAMGTPMNIAVMPRMFEAGVPNLFPISAAVQMYEPLHPMKYSYFVSYRDQARAGMAHMTKKFGIKSVCLQALATDYGAEVEVGFNQAVEELGLDVTYVGHHKGAETEFTGTVTAIKNSGCELLVLGPFVKDTILLYSAARDAGWDAPIIGNMVSYVPEVAQASNGRTEGLYTVASFYMPDFELAAEGSWTSQWYARYRELFNEEPAAQSIIGYVIADLTVRALEAAGPDVSVEKVLAALEKIENYEDPFGGPSLTFSPTKHQGGNYLYLYEVIDSKWQVIEERLPF